MEAGQFVNILILTKYPVRGPSSRYRFLQYLPFLTEAGHTYKVLPFFSDAYLGKIFEGKRLPPWYVPSRFLNRVTQAVGARGFDLVWIEGELMPWLPASLERLLHPLLPRRRVYEFDDAIWLRYEGKPFLANKFRALLSRATAIVTGNEFLAEYALAVNDQVTVVPTTIDWQRYEPAKPELNGTTIGWIGSNQTVFFLESILSALREVAQRIPFTLKVVGAQFEADGITVESVPWSSTSELACITSFDVGIMPLEDNRWARGKCGLKLIQYLAAGVPAVASPVGVNTRILTESQGGYSAASHADWVENLEKILADNQLRKNLGLNGRNWAQESASLQAWAPKLIDFLVQAAAK